MSSALNQTFRRRGVSVMEVLMSIGIVSVGLLGVVALVPVGGHQAERGFMEDYKALYGKSAFRQFELRGMADPGKWRTYSLPNNYAQTPHGFCLDPRFISRHDPSSTPAAARFPYTRPSGTDYFTSASISTGSLTAPEPLYRVSLNTPSGVMPAALADLIFQSNDDLRLDKPDDRTMPPVVWDAAPTTHADDSETIPRPWQSFDDTSGLDDPNQRAIRQSQGQLSWMATIVPKVELGGVTDDLFILSLVVFENRELDAGTLDGVTERVVNVRQSSASNHDFFGGGFGGGEVDLMVDNGNTGDDLINEFDDFGPGNWLMLMRNSPQGTIYRWYKVIAADDELTASNTKRTVTLDGPDWNIDTGNPHEYPTRAVIVPGVVAVYEKVVRLEGSSLFEF